MRPAFTLLAIGKLFKMWEKWSGRKDLNLRPPGPEPGALARLRYAPTDTLRR